MCAMYANDNIQTLHAAVSSNVLPLVREMLAKGVSVEDADYFSVRPIHIAAGQGHLDIVKFLIDLGCDVNVKTGCPTAPQQENAALQGALHHIALITCSSTDESDLPNRSNFGASPLHLAAQYGHLPVVMALVSANANVNAEDDAKETPLITAASYNRENVAIFLVHSGSDVNAKDVDDWTAMHWSASKGNVDVTRLLIDKQAAINAVVAYGDTPLHRSIHCRHYAVSRLLIDSGADVNARDNLERTALCLGAQIGFSTDTARLLIAKGASVNESDMYRRTPLHYAAKNSFLSILQVLFRHRADVNATDNLEWTPLHCAAYEGNGDIVKSLIEDGAKVNVRTEKLATPLHLAADHWHEVVVRLLLERGAEVNATDDVQWTALHFAVDESSTRPSFRHSKELLWNRKLSTVEALVEKGADVNAVGSTNETALHVCAKYGDTVAFKYLLKKGAYYDIKNSSYYGSSTVLDMTRKTSICILVKAIEKLFVAVQKGECGEVMQCIREGAVVNMRSFVGHQTPLMYACLYGHLSVVKILLANGADTNMTNSIGITALHHAAKLGHHEILCVLLQHDAIYNAKNNYKLTPLQYAREGRHERVVNTLEMIECVFSRVIKGDYTVFDKLNELKRLNYNEFLTLRRCTNEDKQTVIDIALKNGYRFQKLRNLFDLK